MALTDIVTDFEVLSRPGFCGFRLREIFDEDMQRFVTVAAHNCQGYGVNLTLYMLPVDWDKVERTFKIANGEGELVSSVDELECTNVNSFRTCNFYLSPANPRMGLLMEPGSYGLMTYSARWKV